MANTSHALELIIEQQIQQHYPNHREFLLAFSGGLDSTALLILFAKLRQKLPHFALRAIHIHHGLSPNADSWAQHCQQICQQLTIPFLWHKVQVDPQNGIEQGAREARYHAIKQLRQTNEIVVTAHHQQDQTETFFLALKRGSGLQGLSAMQAKSAVYNLPIFRPLLTLSRSQLETYVQSQNIPWIEDESNQDNRYDRNFLRHQILSPLRERWAYIDQTIQRSAQHCFEQQQLINELLAEEFHKIYRKTDRTLSIADFANYSKTKQCALLRLWFSTQQIPMPTQIQLSQLIDDVIFAHPDRNPQFQLQQKMLRRYQSRLYLTPKFNPVVQYELAIKLNEYLTLPDGLGTLSLSKNQENITALWQQSDRTLRSEFSSQHTVFNVRFRYAGKVKLHSNDRHRDIKKIWQTLNVPSWERQRIPLIFEGEKLKSAVGFFEIYNE